MAYVPVHSARAGSSGAVTIASIGIRWLVIIENGDGTRSTHEAISTEKDLKAEIKKMGPGVTYQPYHDQGE